MTAAKVSAKHVRTSKAPAPAAKPTSVKVTPPVVKAAPVAVKAAPVATPVATRVTPPVIPVIKATATAPIPLAAAKPVLTPAPVPAPKPTGDDVLRQHVDALCRAARPAARAVALLSDKQRRGLFKDCRRLALLALSRLSAETGRGQVSLTCRAPWASWRWLWRCCRGCPSSTSPRPPGCN